MGQGKIPAAPSLVSLETTEKEKQEKLDDEARKLAWEKERDASEQAWKMKEVERMMRVQAMRDKAFAAKAERDRLAALAAAAATEKKFVMPTDYSYEDRQQLLLDLHPEDVFDLTDLLFDVRIYVGLHKGDQNTIEKKRMDLLTDYLIALPTDLSKGRYRGLVSLADKREFEAELIGADYNILKFKLQDGKEAEFTWAELAPKQWMRFNYFLAAVAASNFTLGEKSAFSLEAVARKDLALALYYDWFGHKDLVQLAQSRAQNYYKDLQVEVEQLFPLPDLLKGLTPTGIPSTRAGGKKGGSSIEGESALKGLF